MQLAGTSFIKDQVWTTLRDILLSYSKDKRTLASAELERITKQILKEEGQAEVHYLVRNLNRIDSDNNGQIDIDEFATFLIKRHCGEMALQKMHRNKLIAHHDDRKIKPGEFVALLNEAYHFLHLNVDEASANEIFQRLDTNRDGLITYVEYFKFIESQLHNVSGQIKSPTKSEKSTASVPAIPAPPSNENTLLTRFRRFLWSQLLKIYIKYDRDGNGNLDDQQLTLLLHQLLKQKSQSRLDYVFKNAFRMDLNNDTQFTFQQFAVFFIKHSCELALDRFNRQRQVHNRRDINATDFVFLFRNSFCFIAARLEDAVIGRILAMIDLDRDGVISYRDYLQWVIELVNFRTRSGMPIYLEEDDGGFDEFLGKGAVGVEVPLLKLQSNKSKTQLPAPTTSTQQLQQQLSRRSTNSKPPSTTRSSLPSPRLFTSAQLSDQVKSHTLKLLLSFDRNNNRQVDEDQVVEILRSVLKENSTEINYVTKNFLRYKFYRNKPVTFEVFVEFFLGLHCGEMAIQRLHREGFYVRGADRLMSEQEFVRTLESAFTFIGYTARLADLKLLFADIDTSKSGWISYQDYFGALKQYFKYSQPARIKISYRYPQSTSTTPLGGTPLTTPLATTRSQHDHSTQDKVGDMIRRLTLQLIARYDQNRNLQFQSHQVVRLMKEVFNEAPHEIEYVVRNMFRYDPNGDGVVSYDELANFILEIHCGEIALQRLHREKRIERWEQRMLSLGNFFLVMEEAFGFLDVVFRSEDLTVIFNHLDVAKTGYVPYSKYFGYIRDSMGSKRQRPQQQQPLSTSRSISSSSSKNSSTVVTGTTYTTTNYFRGNSLPSSVPDLSAVQTTSVLTRLGGYAQSPYKY